MKVHIVPVSGRPYDDPFLYRAIALKKLLETKVKGYDIIAASGNHSWELVKRAEAKRVPVDSVKTILQNGQFVETVEKKGNNLTVKVKVSQ